MPSSAVKEKKTGSGKGIGAVLVLCILAVSCALGLFLFRSQSRPPASTPSPIPTATSTSPPADTEPPVIEGLHDMTVAVGMTLSYRSGVTAVDKVDGKVKLEIDASAVNLLEPGKYPVATLLLVSKSQWGYRQGQADVDNRNGEDHPQQ